jgi:glycosyltransferase involved in cell wall biosynthesis
MMDGRRNESERMDRPERLRVGLDARFATRRPRRGIGAYSLNLMRKMCQMEPNVEFFVYIDRPDQAGELPVGTNVHVRLVRHLPYPLWEQVALPLMALMDRLDVLHCLGNTAPLVLTRKVRLILSLHDVMFLQSGKEVPTPVTTYQRIGRWYRRVVAPRCARRAATVVTVSLHAKADILKYIAGLEASNVVVTYQSCDQAFSLDSSAVSLPSGMPFILCLGAHDPRKNTSRIVRAYLGLVAKGSISEKLVIVGYRGWQHSEIFQEVVRGNATDRVEFKDFVSLGELVALYRNANFLVYPSLYEGFGIPVLEAFSTGCPVITSRVSSLPEIGGEAALYVDPTREDEIATAMSSLSNDAQLRASLAAKGYARARAFDWARTARKTLATYIHAGGVN